MKTRTRVILLATAIAAGFSAPALADFTRIGSVDVGYQMDRDTSWTRFGGRMEGLRVMAGGSDIYCRNITVTFGNGQRQNAFHGVLQANRPVYIDVRGGERHVNRIDFTCRSDRFRGGKIYVAADVGRFRDEWRRSPGWAAYWSQKFNWGGGGYNDANTSDWVNVGHQRFVGGRDVEQYFAGWGGRSVDRIGLRAQDGDARCTRVRVRFGNGRTRDLNVDQLYRMQQGRLYRIDLPGNDRNIDRISLTCRGLGQRAVTIGISARK